MFYAFMICKQLESYSQTIGGDEGGTRTRTPGFILVTRLAVEGLTNWAHPAVFDYK